MREAAGYLGKVQPSLSRMETGQYPVREDEVIAYLDICGVKDPHKRTDLLTMCRDVGQRGWWDGYDGDVASTLMDRLWIEARVSRIQECDVTYISGLLQTPEYAEALLRINPSIEDREIERLLEVRMTRQHIITKHYPTELHCLIDAQLLRRRTGSSEVMARQLEYLAEVGTRSNIEIRVLPSDICLGVDGPFEVMTLAAPYPQVGFVGTSAGDICVEGERVERLARTYDRLLEISLDPEASRELIIAERNKL